MIYDKWYFGKSAHVYIQLHHCCDWSGDTSTMVNLLGQTNLDICNKTICVGSLTQIQFTDMFYYSRGAASSAFIGGSAVVWEVTINRVPLYLVRQIIITKTAYLSIRLLVVIIYLSPSLLVVLGTILLQRFVHIAVIRHSCLKVFLVTPALTIYHY